MEFVGNGRFLLAPVGADGAAAYAELHLECLETAYADIIDPGFARRIRAVAQDVVDEDVESLARPDTTAFMAWADPVFEDGAGLAAGDEAIAGAGTEDGEDVGGVDAPRGDPGAASGSESGREPDASSGPSPDPRDFTRPVGLALALDGPQDWEWHEVGAHPLEGVGGKPPRDLVNMYLQPEVQGCGLGRHLMDAVVPPQDPAYLWIINGNHRAERFYERQGFVSLGEAYPAGGPWAPSTTGRMVRGLAGPASS